MRIEYVIIHTYKKPLRVNNVNTVKKNGREDRVRDRCDRDRKSNDSFDCVTCLRASIYFCFYFFCHSRCCPFSYFSVEYNNNGDSGNGKI